MPELNGIQLLSCVKQDASLRAVPVVSESSAAPCRSLRLDGLLPPAAALPSAPRPALLLLLLFSGWLAGS